MRVTISAIKADIGGIGGHTRPSEVFCIFAADKTEPGAYNFPLWRMFVDARSNTGLLINEKLASGVVIAVLIHLGLLAAIAGPLYALLRRRRKQ